jgi:hypothetical protein
MKVAGWCVAALGVAIALASLAIETSVTVDTPQVSLYGSSYSTKQSVINIGLLQQQMMVFFAGAFAFLAGVILAGVGTIVEILAPAPAVARVEATAPAPIAPVEHVPLDPETKAKHARADVWASVGFGIMVLIVAIVWVASTSGGASVPAGNAASAVNAQATADTFDAIGDAPMDELTGDEP